MTNLKGNTMTNRHVFFDENEAIDSDIWPQLVYTGDYYSHNLGKEMPGEWVLYHGDRNADDGCDVWRTGVRGAAAADRALRTVKGTIEEETK